MRQLKKHNLSDEAANLLKKSIQKLVFPPGSRLIVDSLANIYNVSRSPIRDSLKLLLNEGFVEYDGLSYRVIQFTRKDVEEILEIRKALEVLALKTAAKNIEQNKIRLMKEEAEKFYKDKSINDVDSMIDYDSRFHKIICQCSDNDRLIKLLLNHYEKCWMIQRILYSSSDYNNDSYFLTFKEHLSILKALEKCEVKNVIDKLAAHLERSEKDILAASCWPESQ